MFRRGRLMDRLQTGNGAADGGRCSAFAGEVHAKSGYRPDIGWRRRPCRCRNEDVVANLECPRISRCYFTQPEQAFRWNFLDGAWTQQVI